MSLFQKFTIEERVLWGDVDAAKIIFYGSYVRFFGIAETELFRAVGMPYGKVFDEMDIWLPRVHLDSDCHRAFCAGRGRPRWLETGPGPGRVAPRAGALH